MENARPHVNMPAAATEADNLHMPETWASCKSELRVANPVKATDASACFFLGNREYHDEPKVTASKHPKE